MSISIFNLINNENSLSRYQTDVAVPKLKVTQQLIEEIYSAPDPLPPPKPCPIKPMKFVKIRYYIVFDGNAWKKDMKLLEWHPIPFCHKRLLQPVQYGTKAEGRLAAITSTVGQSPPVTCLSTTTSVATTSLSGQARGKTIATTASSHGKITSE